MRSLLDSSCAVTGTEGDLLPRFFIKFVQVRLDRELLAARRAAHGHLLSTDFESHFLAAGLALHKKPQTTDFTAEDAEVAEKNNKMN